MAKEGGFAEIASNSRLTLLYSFLGQHRNWQRADRASRSAARLLWLAEAAKEDVVKEEEQQQQMEDDSDYTL